MRCTAGEKTPKTNQVNAYLALQLEEIALLKQAMFDLFPDLSPEEFAHIGRNV